MARKQFTVHLDETLALRVAELADQDTRTFSRMVERLLLEAVRLPHWRQSPNVTLEHVES